VVVDALFWRSKAVRRFRQEEQASAFGRRGKQASFEDLIDYEAIAS
jgi:hypothetical protein